MLRDLVDRFAYRYRLWVGETQGDKVGAGSKPVEASPRNEPVWRMVSRFLQIMAGGLMLLLVLYRLALRTFPSLSDGLPLIFIFVAVIWAGGGLFVMGGELLMKFSKSDDDPKDV